MRVALFSIVALALAGCAAVPMAEKKAMLAEVQVRGQELRHMATLSNADTCAATIAFPHQQFLCRG